jgi:hypothetical protein
MGIPNPLNAMQILWINIIMDGPPAQRWDAMILLLLYWLIQLAGIGRTVRRFTIWYDK